MRVVRVSATDHAAGRQRGADRLRGRARKDSNLAFKGDLDLLKGMRVGAVRQINYGPRFEHARPTLALPALRNDAAAITQLAPPLDIVPSSIAFSKRRQLSSLRDKFDAALKRFKTTPDYRHLLEKYRREGSLNLQKALPADGTTEQIATELPLHSNFIAFAWQVG